MKIKLLTNCPGKSKCSIFRSAENLLDRLGEKMDFRKMMTAVEVVAQWKSMHGCPFAVIQAEDDEDEFFHHAICSLESEPPFSMEAVSRGTGYSKTRVAQIEYSAIRKFRKALSKEGAAEILFTEYGIDVNEPSTVAKSRL